KPAASLRSPNPWMRALLYYGFNGKGCLLYRLSSVYQDRTKAEVCKGRGRDGMRLHRFTAIFVLLLAVNVAAQTTSGSMSGTVIDASGKVVPGADVTITNENTGEKRNTITNETGDFLFPGLTAGPYSIQVQLAGFKSIDRKNNVVLANNRLAVGSLKLEIGELTESVTVTSRGEYVATTQTS